MKKRTEEIPESQETGIQGIFCHPLRYQLSLLKSVSDKEIEKEREDWSISGLISKTLLQKSLVS